MVLIMQDGLDAGEWGGKSPFTIKYKIIQVIMQQHHT